MAYQRTEYADKTLSRNSFADRKLKIQLDSINCHKDSTEKEIDREKKKIRKELAEAEEYMKNRLSVNNIAAGSEKRPSPRLPRRYSTPPVALAATLPARNLPEIGKRAHNPNRSLSGPDIMLMKVSCGDQGLSDGPISPRSLTPTLLKPPFNQPRRQSLPPLSPGGIINQDFKVQSVNKTSSPSYSMMTSRSQPITPPRSLSPRESAMFHVESVQMEDVTSKVNKFLKSFDKIKKEQNCDTNTGQTSRDEDNNRLEAYEGNSEVLSTSGSLKRCSSVGLFQPANFE